MRKIALMTIAIFIIIGILSAGCTKYAKKEDLQKLDGTKSATLAAEKTLLDKQKERMDWEQKLQQKESELQAKKLEKDEIAKKVVK
jgi:outer membrane murein-binding lipoprotein Lpp